MVKYELAKIKGAKKILKRSLEVGLCPPILVISFGSTLGATGDG